MIRTFSLVLISVVMSLTTGCATMQDFLASLDGPKAQQPDLKDINSAPKYSDSPNMGVPTDRKYKKMTRNRMEEEADLGSTAGSMWVMEGQGAYLFAQNKMRKEGDLLNVNLDGPARKQVETKVSVIKKLLKQLEEQEQQLSNSLAENSGDAGRAPAAAKPAEPAAPKDEKEEGLADVQNIPTRIVEKLPDGNYRIKGQQPFMIGKRDYKVIVTGLIRPEDFNDAGISSEKLLDPQYDVVSLRKNKSNE